MMGDRTVCVLHVDDDPAMLDLMLAFLERRDVEARLESVSDGTAALDIIRSDPDAVDVVVSDFSLPEDGGLALLESVRAAFPDLPFIFFTGRADHEAAALERGATDYLVKGSAESLDQLARRIVEAVDTSADASQATQVG